MGDDRPMRYAAGALVFVAACNALTGVGDLNEVPCVCDDASRDAPAPSDAPSADAEGAESASADAPVADAPVEAGSAMCAGILLYVTFDGTLTSQEGVAPAPSAFSPSYVVGKFGKALDLSAIGFDDVAYPVTSDAGATLYAATQGTIALWVKPRWSQPCTTPHTFVTPTADTFLGLAAGPEIVCAPTPGVLGTHVSEADGGDLFAGYGLAGASREWVDQDWNLLVATWSESAPSLTFTLNGAPTKTSSAPWLPAQGNAHFVRLGAPTSPPESAVDDLTIWGRVLSAAEIQTLYTSGNSIAQSCAL